MRAQRQRQGDNLATRCHGSMVPITFSIKGNFAYQVWILYDVLIELRDRADRQTDGRTDGMQCVMRCSSGRDA